jgi:hypothetical protein
VSGQYAANVWRQRFGFATVLALGLTAVAIVVAVVKHLPYRDPDGVVGPTFVLLPIILTLAFLTDVVPRAVGAPCCSSVPSSGRSRWSAGRWSASGSPCSGSAAGT